MKKSRTGKSILLILALMVIFATCSLLVAHYWDKDGETFSMTDLVGQSNKIGVINIEGQIMSSDELMKDLRKFQRKSSIRAIIVRINSPGGAVAPAQELYRELGKIRVKKPVVVSIETVGTSAAYYIASNADKIVCSSGSITGSIGVIMMLPDVQKVIERIGIDVRVIKAGKYKDIGSLVRPLTEEERELLETFASEIHEQFIGDVIKARKGKVQEQEIREIADGRFFTGDRAMHLGLVDTIGNFFDAVKIAAEMSNIQTEPELVYPKKKWDSYLDVFLESVSGAVFRAADLSSLTRTSPEVR